MPEIDESRAHVRQCENLDDRKMEVLAIALS